jgi:thiamine-phosphate diphosphorylase
VTGGTGPSLAAAAVTLIPRLHIVTDDDVLARGEWASVAKSILSVGGSHVALHVRGPRASGAEVFRSAAQLRALAEQVGGWVVVNDRLDVALALGFPAVHLGGRSLDVRDARRVAGAGVALGVSTHSLAEVSTAMTAGADYLFAGPIYATQSHSGVAGIGPVALTDLVRAATNTPVIGIGGIDSTRVAEVMRSGCHGVAVIRGIWDAPDPVEAVAEYISALGQQGVEA